jgi:hypothetical protein
VRGAVHQRRGRQGPEPTRRCGGDDLLDVLEVGAVPTPDAERGDQEVLLAPHRPLGHAGGAAGVAEVQVVAGPAGDHIVGKLDRRGGRTDRGERRVVVDGAGDERVTAAVGDLQDQRRWIGQRVQHRGERRSEALVDDHRPGRGVVEQVAQLIGDVAVVDVERSRPRLPCSEHPLEVLVAVVEVQGDVVVHRLPARTRSELGAEPDAGVEQHAGQSAGAVSDVGPAQSSVPEHQAVAVGMGGGDRLGDHSDVQLHGRHAGRMAW